MLRDCEMIKTDVVIVGAGPVGLFQVFELGLLGLKSHLLDSMAQPGGQCVELYPDKPIYDIPGLPVCGAQELIERLQEQIRPFEPQYHLSQTVTEVQAGTNGRFEVATSAGTEFDCAAVIIAGGLGAFEPRRLHTDGVTQLEGDSLHYRVREPSAFAGKNLVIAGGGDTALDWALNLVEIANSVVLVHRSRKFRAAPASVNRMHALCNDLRMQFLEGDVVGIDHQDTELNAVRVRNRAGVVNRVEAEQLLVFWGLHPKLGPIAQWGLDLDRSQICVDTENFQTSVPGIFAVGDINTYPGKKKLILSGFHESALAAFAVKARLQPGTKVPLQYTTTSPLMHRRLKVDPERPGLVDAA